MAVGFEIGNGVDERLIRNVDKLYVSLGGQNGTAANYIGVELVKRRDNSRADRVRGRRGSSVFRTTRGTNSWIVYTGLALIDAKQKNYKSMPIKLDEATIWVANRLAKRAGGGKLVGEGQTPQVYVNYMSDNRFERRQQYSGKIDRVHWFAPPSGQVSRLKGHQRPKSTH